MAHIFVAHCECSMIVENSMQGSISHASNAKSLHPSLHKADSEMVVIISLLVKTSLTIEYNSLLCI